MNEPFGPALKDKIFKTAVVLTGDDEKIISIEKFGPTDTNVKFEIGSLTQPLCTSLAMILLTADLNLNLNAPVGKYITEFGEEGKEKITLKQLLKHTSGLPKTKPYLNEGLDKNDLLEKICYEELDSPPAFERKKSDLGYIILGIIVERLSKLPLDQFFNERIAKPLGLNQTVFSRPKNALGHTGLISTIEDCWKIVSAILSCYFEIGTWIPKPTLDEFIGPKVRYKLGWETGEPPFPQNTIGMISNTGCTLWIDLEQKRILEVFTQGSNESLHKWLPQVYQFLMPF